MQNQLTIHRNQGLGQINASTFLETLTVKLNTWLNRMVGCWHKELSRPFSSQGQTYRVCINCGARRAFNVGRWEMQGGFYYSLPTTRHFGVLSGMVARPAKSRLTIVPRPQTSRCA
jgi:hypothetical protein